MSKRTRATIALDKAGINFTLHSYDYDPDAERVGLQAAEALGIEPRRLLKTLMVEVDSKPACVVVPSDREVSLKKLALAFQGKTAKMMRPADAERLTGYRIGGISPFAQKKRVRVAPLVSRTPRDAQPLVRKPAHQETFGYLLCDQRQRIWKAPGSAHATTGALL
jgi:Cys-tRNA(Pro)/Cys-tRNA(Cys) deacylase